MKLPDALATMQDYYAPTRWPKDWYGYEMDVGWAFIAPSRPGVIVVVANNGRVADLDYTEPQGATAAAETLLRKLQQ